jgi:hypothetical protein
VQELLARLPRRIIERVAADSVTPRLQAEVLASYILSRWEPRHLVSAALRHRTGKEKKSRIAALRILELSGYHGLWPLLDSALNDTDPDIVGAAVVILGQMHEEAAARRLVDALRRQIYAPSRIATQLDRFSIPIVHLLWPLLNEPVPVVRFWGATLLARYPGNTSLNRRLASLRYDRDPGVRKAAVETLGRIGEPYAAKTAVALLKDPAWFVRAHAARALGDLRRVDFCHLVTPLLTDHEWWVRAAAKDALEAMGPGVAEHLMDSLESGDRFARNGAAEVLQNLGILDTLVAQSIDAKEDPDRLRLIGKILAAGGADLMEAARGRAAGHPLSEVANVLEQAVLRYGRAG